MVEQFGVRGHIAASAEVIHARHEAGAEQLLPDAVHGHAGGERVAFVGEPVGELKASALAGGNGGELVP